MTSKNRKSPGLRDVVAQLAALQRMPVGELADKFRELFGRPTTSRNKAYLRKQLAWRIQEIAEGGLSERALSRILELGDTLPERWRARLVESNPLPPPERLRDPRLPRVGTVLVRVHAGEEHRVIVRDAGFEYRGENYKTLSAIAKQITNMQWSGFAFFRLNDAGRTSTEAA